MIRLIEHIEESSEIVPTKEQILEVMYNYVNKFEIINEKSDEKGLFLFEVMIQGDNPYEFYIYCYMRKGEYDKIGYNSVTSIFYVRFENNIQKDGKTVAELDEETGEWIDLGNVIKKPGSN